MPQDKPKKKSRSQRLDENPPPRLQDMPATLRRRQAKEYAKKAMEARKPHMKEAYLRQAMKRNAIEREQNRLRRKQARKKDR